MRGADPLLHTFVGSRRQRSAGLVWRGLPGKHRGMRARSVTLIALASLGTACGGDRAPEPRGGVSELALSAPVSPGPEPLATATTRAPSVAPTGSTRAPAVTPQLSQPEIASAFLPHESNCQSDADCAATRFGVAPTFTCCDPCDSAAGTKAWVARADARCEAMHRANQVGICPPRDCASLGAKCISGHCAPAFPDGGVRGRR